MIFPSQIRGKRNRTEPAGKWVQIKKWCTSPTGVNAKNIGLVYSIFLCKRS